MISGAHSSVCAMPMEALGKPWPLAPAPALGLGVRARLAWKLWRWRAEA